MLEKRILIFLLLFTLAPASYISAAVITEFADTYELPNGWPWFATGINKTWFTAQAFEIQGSPTIVAVQLNVGRVSPLLMPSTNGDMIMQLRADTDGSPSSQVLSEVRVPITEIPITYNSQPLTEWEGDWITFEWFFPNGPVLSPGRWWIVCTLSDDTDTYCWWSGMNNRDAPAGEYIERYGTFDDTISSDDGTIWSQALLADMHFKVFGVRQTKDTTVSVSANPDTVVGPGVSIIEVTVRADGELVNGFVTDAITLIATHGSFADSTPTLDNGVATTIWTAPDLVGTYNIEAVYPGHTCGSFEYNPNSGDTDVYVEEEPDVTYYYTDTVLTPVSTSIGTDQSTLINVSITKQSTGEPIYFGSVTFSCDEGEFFGGANPYPVTAGYAGANWQPPKVAGQYEVRAHYSGFTLGPIGYRVSSDTNNISVSCVDRDPTISVSISPDYAYVGKSTYVIVDVQDSVTGRKLENGLVEFSDDAPAGESSFTPSTINLANRNYTIWQTPPYDPSQFLITASYLATEPYNIANGIRYNAGENDGIANVVVDEEDDFPLSWMSQWIADYNCCGGLSDVANAEFGSQNFTNKLQSDLLWLGSEFPNEEAQAKHFRAGHENTYMDNHDFIWYCGHGSPDYISFTHPSDERKFYFSDALDPSDEPTWGDTDAEWLALWSCRVLSNDSKWAETMNGLHLICGFHTIAWSNANFPKIFAASMIKENVHDTPHQVDQAWFLAGEQAQPNTVTQVVIGESFDMLKDYLWGQGLVQNDPGVDSGYTYTCNDVSNQSPIADINIPTNAIVGQPVALDASGTTDSDSSTLWYRWDLHPFIDTDDGDYDLDQIPEPNDDCDIRGRIVQHTWNFTGEYTLRLIVRDDTANIDDAWATIDIVPPKGPVNISDEKIQTRSNGGIEIIDNFPNLPTEDYLPLFCAVDPNVGFTETMNIADYWGMTSTSTGLDELGNWHMLDGDHELTVNKYSSSVMYLDHGRAYVVPEDILFFNPTWLPDPCAARSIAEQFILDNDIVFDPCELVFNRVADIAADEGNKGDRLTPSGIPFQRRVIHNRNLIVDGPTPKPYPVFGPGGKVITLIDETTHVIMFLKIWRQVMQDEEVELYSAESAIDDFHRLGPKALLPECWVPPSQIIEINNVTLGYYEQDFVTDQNIIYPVYALDLICDYNEISQKVQVYMPAVSPPLEAVIGIPDTAVDVNYGDMVHFTGYAMGGTPLYTYQWQSDVNGVLSTNATFDTSSLKVRYSGEDCYCDILPHTISLTVTDSMGLKATSFVKVYVHGPCADFNRDNEVNFVDFAIFAQSWLLSLGDHDYNSFVNFDKDNLVSTMDLCLFVNEWLME